VCSIIQACLDKISTRNFFFRELTVERHYNRTILAAIKTTTRSDIDVGALIPRCKILRRSSSRMLEAPW
jgi:hypothetical protein